MLINLDMFSLVFKCSDIPNTVLTVKTHSYLKCVTVSEELVKERARYKAMADEIEMAAY